MPRFHAACGTTCARSGLAPLSVKRCVLSARSPSRNAGSSSSLTGRLNVSGGWAIVAVAASASAAP